MFVWMEPPFYFFGPRFAPPAAPLGHGGKSGRFGIGLFRPSRRDRRAKAHPLQRAWESFTGGTTLELRWRLWGEGGTFAPPKTLPKIGTPPRYILGFTALLIQRRPGEHLGKESPYFKPWKAGCRVLIL